MESILIIKDEINPINELFILLTKQNYKFSIVYSFSGALLKLHSVYYDVILFDINKKHTECIDLIKQIKKEKIQSSIIVASSEICLEKKITVIETGADDYLTKPYFKEELLIRIKSQIRRNQYKGCNTLSHHEIKIEIDTRKVFIKNKQIYFTAKEYDLLIYFILNKGRALNKENIMFNVWRNNDDYIVSNEMIYTHIKNLRKKILLSGSKDYLKSIYKYGYQWLDD